MKKNTLADEPFSYQLLKNESIHIFHHNRRVTVINGANAKKLGKKLAKSSGIELQKALAKATGNFKRGNE